MTKTYVQLAREIAALQASAKKLLAIEAKGAIAKINDLISKYGLSASDLKFGLSPAVSPRAANAKKSGPGTAAAGAKYSDEKGNQWGGRGPRPAWLRSALAAGRALESFAVGVTKAAVSMAPVAAAPEPIVVAKPIASGSVQSTRATKLKSPKTQAAAKESLNAALSVPAVAATGPVTSDKPKVAEKAPARAQPAPLVKPPVKKAAAPKSGAAKAASDSRPVKKSNGAKKVGAASTSIVSAARVAAKKATTKKAATKPAVNAAKVPARKKAGTTSAPRKASLAKSAAPVVREAEAASATA